MTHRPLAESAHQSKTRDKERAVTDFPNTPPPGGAPGPYPEQPGWPTEQQPQQGWAPQGPPSYGDPSQGPPPMGGYGGPPPAGSGGSNNKPLFVILGVLVALAVAGGGFLLLSGDDDDKDDPTDLTDGGGTPDDDGELNLPDPPTTEEETTPTTEADDGGGGGGSSSGIEADLSEISGMSDAEDVITSFVQHEMDKNCASMWTLTSSKYPDEDEFVTSCEEDYGAMGDLEVQTLSVSSVSDSTIEIDSDQTIDGDPISASYTMILEEGTWWVDSWE